MTTTRRSAGLALSDRLFSSRVWGRVNAASTARPQHSASTADASASRETDAVPIPRLLRNVPRCLLEEGPSSASLFAFAWSCASSVWVPTSLLGATSTSPFPVGHKTLGLFICAGEQGILWVVFCFFETGSHSSPSWPQTYCSPPVSAIQMLGLWVCAPSPGPLVWVQGHWGVEMSVWFPAPMSWLTISYNSRSK